MSTKNVVRLMYNDKFQFDFNDRDVWTMFHSFCFDFSVWEMYGALLYGGKLVVVPKIVAQDTKEYLELLRKEKVTVLNQTPSAFYNLINEELPCNGKELALRYVIFGGEALKPAMLKEWEQKYPDTKLINMYGITETTVHVTYKEITQYEIDLNISNIGKPIPTLTTYIMDRNMKLLPIGVPGELCVGGDGVGRGYMNRPELTAEKFVENPYKAGERLYRSGDLAKLLPDGEMEYLGRIDQQVKIRGFRIELGEIESRLFEHEAVKKVVVLDKEKQGNKLLCAYYVAEGEPTVAQLREYLAEMLPDYMIPSYFVKLEQIPVTSNGKVDRKALPEPEASINTGVDYAAPENEVEEKLVEIWRDLLGIEKIGTLDNFFELGGHSLKATVLVSRIHKEFNIRLPLKEVFKAANIKELARYIQACEIDIYSSIKPVEEKEFYPVSSAQKRLFVFNRVEGENKVYNMPTVMIIQGLLEKERLESAFDTLVQRHETLRTSFDMVDGEVIQKVHKEIAFKIDYLKCDAGNSASESELLTQADKLVKEYIRPFDLSKAPLLRVGLVELSESKYVLIFDIHHIISDGVSTSVLTKEFIDLYGGKSLPEMKIQYKDFSAWQNDLLKSDIMRKQEEYWLNTFSGKLPVLSLPTDYQRPLVQSFEGDIVGVEIGKELKDKLNKIAADTGSTMYMVLLSAYNVLLSKCAGQEDIIIGSPIAGRPHADLENIIGMFVNTLAMRNYPRKGMTFTGFLSEVAENSLKAFENQDYQFEDLVNKIAAARDSGRNPLFDTMFVMQNMDNSNLEINGLTIAPFDFENRVVKFDLVLNVRETEDGIYFGFEYCTALFKKETIEMMREYLVNIIERICEKPDIRLSDIDILSKAEMDKIASEIQKNEELIQIDFGF